MTTLLAIDPGAKGAACLYGGHTLVSVLEVVKFAGRDEQDIAAQIARLASNADRAVIERVHAMPGGGDRKMGATSAFSFGRGYGFLRACLCHSHIPWEDVAPPTWQKDLGLGKCAGPERKRKLRALAAQRFRDQNPTLDTCDAMLLAEWAWLRWKEASA